MTHAEIATEIEQSYGRAIKARAAMFEMQRAIRHAEATAKVDHLDEWASAKNNDVRFVLLATWLQDNEEYWKQRRAYDSASEDYRMAHLEIARLKLLIQLVAATN